jgi:glycerol-3-phosphate O-acyltransferase
MSDKIDRQWRNLTRQRFLEMEPHLMNPAQAFANLMHEEAYKIAVDTDSEAKEKQAGSDGLKRELHRLGKRRDPNSPAPFEPSSLRSAIVDPARKE